MKLQLALDTVDIDAALAILADIGDMIDIVEVGTPWIIRDGLKSVTTLKKRFPKLEILADLKIMDAGKYEASEAFAAGADMITVMGVAYDETISGTLEAAKEFGRKVMVDLLAVIDPIKRGLEMQHLGAHYACIHTAFDLQYNHNPLEDLSAVSIALDRAGIAVAGGINCNTLPDIIRCKPGIVIVGGALVNPDPETRIKIATAMNALLHNSRNAG